MVIYLIIGGQGQQPLINMAKIIPVMGIMILINVMLFMFTFSGADCKQNCSIEDMNTESGNSIWEFVSNPTDVSNSSFWERLFGSTLGILAALTTAGGLIALGAAIYFKDINIAFISLSIFVAGAIISTWARLWSAVNDSAILGGASGGVMVTLLVGMGLFIHLWFLVDWGRGR